MNKLFSPMKQTKPWVGVRRKEGGYDWTAPDGTKGVFCKNMTTPVFKTIKEAVFYVLQNNKRGFSTAELIEEVTKLNVKVGVKDYVYQVLHKAHKKGLIHKDQTLKGIRWSCSNVSKKQ